MSRASLWQKGRTVEHPRVMKWAHLSPSPGVSCRPVDDVFSSYPVSAPTYIPTCTCPPEDASTCMTASIRAPPAPVFRRTFQLGLPQLCTQLTLRLPASPAFPPVCPFPAFSRRSLLRSVPGSHPEVLILMVTACSSCPDPWNRF